MASRLDTELLITAGVDGLQHIDKLIAKIEEAGGDTEQLRDAARRLNSEWDDLSAEEQASRLRDLGNAANNSAGDLGLLRRRTDEANNSADRLGQGVDSVKGALNGLKGLIATLGISVGATELLEMADSYKTLEAKIKLATGEGVNFINGFGGVQDIANETFTSIEDTGELFARISRAGKEMNLAQQDVLSVTKTINEAIQLSGGSAESNQAAITQLIQGLQSGVVRGEEFNSIMEQSPRLARAMADGLDVTLGQLRAMAAEGKLTSEVVINAVQSQGAAIQSEFDQMPLTIDQSLTQLKNNFLSFVGDIDKQLNSSGGVSSIIQQMANSLDEIDPATVDAVREAFTQLGEIAQPLYGTFSIVTDSVAEVWNAFDGTTAAGEKVGLLTKSFQELSIFIGHVADGVKAIQIVADTVFGGWLMSIGLLSQAYAKLTGSSSDAADAMMAKGDEMVARAKKNALEFESSAKAAADNASKTHQERLDETADKSRQVYEQMAADGTASAGKIQEAYVKSAIDTIKANGDVIDARLAAELAEKGLQAEISKTGDVTITAMQTAKNATADMDSQISDAASSFKALGLDAEYFATGMDSKVTASLSAFSEVAKIAGDDTTMLARAYDAASKQVGTNVQAQDALQTSLLESVNGNSSLADEVKRVALEQRNAIAAADGQSAALSKLGISMDAVNQSMSASGLEMVTTLKSGIVAIKEQATSADALKIALTQALDTSIAAAKTKADFDAINQTLRESGVAGKVSAEQMKLIQAGMQGGEQAAKLASESIDKNTQSLEDNVAVLAENSNVSRANAQAKQEQAAATDDAATATANATQNESASLAFMGQVTAAIKSRITDLKDLGANTELADKAYGRLMDSMGLIEGYQWSGIQDFANSMERVDSVVKSQTDSFEKAKYRAEEMTQALSGTSVTSRDLAQAQHALRQATDASVGGLIRMDQATLDNLKKAIDDTKQKMKDLAEEAKDTADQLEGELARLEGDDDKAREIEQTKKLADIEKKLSDARLRGNQQEIKFYTDALKFQREINKEKNKQAKADERAARKREQPAPSPQSNSSSSSQSNQSEPYLPPGYREASQSQKIMAQAAEERERNLDKGLSAAEVADAWEERIKQAQKQAVEDFMKQLKDEAKRRT